MKHCDFCGDTTETNKLFCKCGQMLKTVREYARPKPRAAAVSPANTPDIDNGASKPSATASRTERKARTS